MQTTSLNGTWRVRQEELAAIGEDGLSRVVAASDGWIPARVPGEIHLDLMAAGLMADPNVGLNVYEGRWPETKSWWYRTSVEVDEAFLAHERQQIVFDGLDLYAQVFVNGRLIGEAANAFVPQEYDVRGALRAGENDLVVRMTAGSELSPDDSPPGQGREPHQPAFGEIPNPAKPGDPYGHRNWFGRTWLRKPQAAYGWDWQDALPNIGIWRGVRLEGRSWAALHDLRLDTLLATGRVSLELEAIVENLHPWSERACVLELTIDPPDDGTSIVRSYRLGALPGRSPVSDVIPVPDAKLWWPNGMGEQPLYRVSARVLDAHGAVCDTRGFSIGLRTIDIDRSRLAVGTRFCVRVNGQDVFCRGGNLGPHDQIQARMTDAKYEGLVAEARDAHFTMFRINGVSVFEPPAFYEACDRAGILILHDFPFACATYPDHDERFRQAVRDEAEGAVRLLRHHPSIAIWCGSNECTWGLADWYNNDPTKPLDLGGARLYNQVLPDACRTQDPRRPYWPSSPAGGDRPNDEFNGDCHWWLPCYMNGEMGPRLRHEVFDECRAHFVSEWGFVGPCHVDSIAEFLPEADRRPGTPAWNLHTNQCVGATLDEAIRRFYTEPEGLSLAEWVEYGQMCQAFMLGHAMEAHRFRKNDPLDECQGALIWSYSDCWGETGWSQLDYYLRRKASYYWVRRACRPVKVIVRRRGDRLVTRVVNDTLLPISGTVEYGWWRLDGKGRDLRTRKVAVPANGMKEVGSDPIPGGADTVDPLRVYAAVLRDPTGVAFDQNVWPMAPLRQIAATHPTLAVAALPDGSLEVSSDTFAHGVHTDDHGHEVISDNWFDLLPGVPVRVRVAPGVDPASLRFGALVSR